ncbi:MAG: ABC transporter substrate-binding protein [Rhodospirillales bacterium]|nr:ABC transporter substrate-binding protein [Alphaproteobacteria bacterium]MCB9987093.1 ABC transporter substrate-binding protein [Rhodospirillales bacterium]USO08146.1 MAG: ABC transporter substrate-binding protein [Rhodospirillales bacterium]
MLRRLLLTAALLLPLHALAAEPVHGLAIYGAPKYQAGFTHFDYVNPDAPKGGTLRLSAIGTFDTLNPFIVKGVPADNLGLLYTTLMTGSSDEAFTEYGLLAESVEMPEDRSSVTFNLRKNAKWSDGQPVTAADVVWSFDTLMKDGAPFYASYYHDVESAKTETPTRVTFKFKRAGNRELPLIMGQMPVLPKHYWEKHDFTKTTLEPPVGDGPYKIASVDPGHSITYERVKDWWGDDLPVGKGRYNFDRITVDYYRDATVAVEAFFANRYDVRQEYIAKVWATGYDAPPVRDGRIVKEEIKNGLPAGMQGFIMNTRRPVFADRAVRRALQYAFDFEWSNKALAHGAYKRDYSYFTNSEYAATGLPEGKELALLEPFRDRLPPELFTQEYKNPVTDGTGNVRDNLRQAAKILDDAGWTIGADGVRAKNGVRLSFEIVDNQAEFERWVLPFIRNLKRIGIEANFRVVDTSQMVARLNDFDYDMTISGFGQSLSPGNEQRDYWGSAKADAPGSRNLIGVKNPVVDAMIDKIATAETREDLVAAVKALDRVLLWNYYVVPQWYTDLWKVAHWNRFGRPSAQAPYDLGIVDTWWTTPESTNGK